jgi:hypothetical protein
MKICQPCGALCSASAPHCVRCGEASWKAAPVLPVLAEMAEQAKAGAEELEAVAPLLMALPVEPEPVTVDSVPVEVGDMVVLVNDEDASPPAAPPIVIEGPAVHIAAPEPVQAPVLVPSAPKFHAPAKRRNNR